MVKKDDNEKIRPWIRDLVDSKNEKIKAVKNECNKDKFTKRILIIKTAKNLDRE